MVIKMFQFVVDKYPEVNKPLSAKYMKSFAYKTFKHRIPTILSGVADHLRNVENITKTFGPKAADEIDDVISKILNLKNSVQSDKPLELLGTELLTLGANNYNKIIKQKTEENGGNPPSWFQTDWLFAECYVYFKLHEIFHTSNALKKFDPFQKSKVESLVGSRTTVLAILKVLIENKGKDCLNEEEKKTMFIFYLKCSLWGNKADLSLSLGQAVCADEESFSSMSNLDNLILANDVELIYQILAKYNDNVIDIVLDNAGYELINDLCFADFLIWSGLACKIIFHGKAIPWFVSDVTALDFTNTFDLLCTEIKSQEAENAVNDWNDYIQKGKWELKFENFWIWPYDFSKMQRVDPELYSSLGQNKIVIFKGDLNYRKLVGDIYWEPTIEFRAALRGFCPTNVVALRTIKADTVSGLQEGVFENLGSKESDWMVTGKYALIQLSKK